MNYQPKDFTMTTTITANSARSTEIDGKTVIQEISYTMVTDAGEFSSAMRLDLDGIDVNDPTFITGPTITQLASFVETTLKASDGAGGCSNAFLTIEKQISDIVVDDESSIADYKTEGMDNVEDEDQELY